MTIDPALASRLAPWGFDNAQLDGFIARLAQAATSNAVNGTLTPPAPEDVRVLPAPGTPEHQRLVKLGKDALAAKKVGVVILAGGMATRFGGVVKAVVPVLEDRTFLKLKLDDVRHAGPDVPVYVMSSFATHERLLQHVKELGAKNVEVFAAVRLAAADARRRSCSRKRTATSLPTPPATETSPSRCARAGCWRSSARPAARC